MNSLKIIYKNINEIKEYNKNPRNNDNSIKDVAESIKQFGFKIPILIDEDGIIICGHTRYKACKLLSIDKIPCIIANDLSEEQIKAFRIVDNKVSEYSRWDYEKLKEELKKINMDFVFDFYNELDVTDDDFINEVDVEKIKEEKIYICPKCGERL